MSAIDRALAVLMVLVIVTGIIGLSVLVVEYVQGRGDLGNCQWIGKVAYCQ